MPIKTLLPTGCYDLLPPAARHEREIVGDLLGMFDRFGYEQVAPPMLEYTESLLAGRGAALAGQTFRIMDPTAHKVMGLRADHTVQIARIAATRLSDAPRPLRLSYAGNILRMQAEALHNERQLRQVGIELIGSISLQADAEVICVAAKALGALGIADISVDIHLPAIIPLLLFGETLDNDQAQELLQAIARKDSAAVRASNCTHANLLATLIESAGTADSAIAALRALEWPSDAAALLDDVYALCDLLKLALPDITLTLDITENRGLEYHSGISFAFYAKGATGELGRGGRYRVQAESKQAEATGFTLYIESLRGLVKAEPAKEKVLVAAPLGDEAYDQLAAQGYCTLQAIPGEDVSKQAMRLGCIYLWQNDTLKKL